MEILVWKWFSYGFQGGGVGPGNHKNHTRYVTESYITLYFTGMQTFTPGASPAPPPYTLEVIDCEFVELHS